jgi:hypothetical protein
MNTFICLIKLPCFGFPFFWVLDGICWPKTRGACYTAGVRLVALGAPRRTLQDQVDSPVQTGRTGCATTHTTEPGGQSRTCFSISPAPGDAKPCGMSRSQQGGTKCATPRVGPPRVRPAGVAGRVVEDNRWVVSAAGANGSRSYEGRGVTTGEGGWAERQDSEVAADRGWWWWPTEAVLVRQFTKRGWKRVGRHSGVGGGLSGKAVLTQNQYPAPSTQQDEQASLTRGQIPKRASQFSLKINKRQSS